MVNGKVFFKSKTKANVPGKKSYIDVVMDWDLRLFSAFFQLCKTCIRVIVHVSDLRLFATVQADGAL